MKKQTKTLKDFCKKADLLRLAYTDSKKYPRVIPVWFVIVSGEYCLGTGRPSPKWKAIQKNGRVGWVIDGGKNGQYKGLSQFGHAEEVTDRRSRSAIYRALSIKYFGAAGHPDFIKLYGNVDDDETVYLRLKAEGGTNWEY